MRALLIVFFGVVFVASCDTTLPQTLDQEFVIDGRVSTVAGYEDDWSDPAAGMRDATVSVAEIKPGGELTFLTGSARSDTEGRYRVVTMPSPHPLIVFAERGTFQRAVLLEKGIATQPHGNVVALPITEESTVEAAVFLYARRYSGQVTASDVSALIGPRLLATIDEASLTPAHVAVAFATSIGAQAEFARAPAGGNAAQVPFSTVQHTRRQAFAMFRMSMYGAVGAQPRQLTVDAFIESYADAWARAGVGLWPQAETSVVGYGTLRTWPGGLGEAGSLALSHRSLLAALTNVSVAIIHGAATSGGGAGSVGSLSIARMELFTALKQAGTPHQVTQALDDYRSVVFEELSALFDIPIEKIEQAYDAVEALRNQLEALLATTTDAGLIADAYATYFNGARSTVKENLEIESDLPARVLATLGAL